MKIDAALFRAILGEVIDENPLACRGVLSVKRVEITKSVETLSVSLGKRSVLRANLSFMNAHCDTEKHVKALLVHEFLHILLGHTIKFDKMTPALNVALDAVINAIIHRKLGPDYSSMMGNYYAGAKGLLRLLGPMDEEERRAAAIAMINRQPLDPLTGLHSSLYNGTALADDVLSVAGDLPHARITAMADGRPILLGDHQRDTSDFCADDEEGRRVWKGLALLDGAGIFRDPCRTRPQSLKLMPAAGGVPAAWKVSTLNALRRLITPDHRGWIEEHKDRTHLFPSLNCADRRGTLRALWNPIIPEIRWETLERGERGTVQVYLDVSASMGHMIRPLVCLLGEFGEHIRRPLWGFSTEVREATIVRGELITRSTGGTRLGCVYEHLRKTRPRKALIITDGYVEGDTDQKPDQCHIEAIIPHDGHELILSGVHDIPVTRLSAGV